MAFHTNTALLLIDPYNDFIQPDGKIYNTLKESIESINTVENIKRLIATARANKISIYYCLHHNWKEGNDDGWNRMTFFTNLMRDRQVVAEGSWGAQIHEGMKPDVKNGDVVIAKQWDASKDATTGFSKEQVEAGTNIIWPTLVNQVLTVDEWAASLKKQKA